MENQIVRRRVNVIAAHLASHEDMFAAATHVFPMSCSNHQNFVIRRCDNRTNFGRQGSLSQGFFMKQASREQVNYIQQNMPLKSTNCEIKGTNAFEAPVFSKPAQVEPGTSIPSVKKNHPVLQSYQYIDLAPDIPMFARPNRKCENERTPNFVGNDHRAAAVEWSPRMDVEESGLNYFVTLEIPGVCIDNIKVEVNNNSLIITGNRSTTSSVVVSCPNEAASSYHKREILQGPCRIVWPLPSNANKEKVSAEIQDGLLRITIPKVSGLRWLRKAYI